MILVRDVFQAKYGRGGELVQLFKEFAANEGSGFKGRLLTDLSGPFFTVVTEEVFESMAAFQQNLSRGFDQPWFEDWFSRMIPLVDHGSREFYTIEAEIG